MLGGRPVSCSFFHPTSLAKATARSKISCRSASPKENTLLTSVNLGLPKGRLYPLSEPSFRGRPNKSLAAIGSSRSTGNCDRSSPTSPTTPHPASTPTPSSITPRRDHETKPPRTPLSTMHQSNHTPPSLRSSPIGGQDPQRHTRTNPTDTTLSVAPASLPRRGDVVRDCVSCYLDFAWVIPKAPWNAGKDKEDSTLSRYPRP